MSPVDELVDDDEAAGRELLLQRSDRRDGEQVGAPGAFQRVDIGACVHMGWRQAMPPPVPREKDEADALNAADEQRVGRRPPRRIDVDPLRLFQRIHRIEAGAADDADRPFAHDRSLGTDRHDAQVGGVGGCFIKRHRRASLGAMEHRTTWRRAGRLLWRSLAGLLLVPALYLLAVLVGGLLTAHAVWREPDTGVTIFVRTNGVHTWILVPTVSADMDWRPLAPANPIREPRLAGNYLAIGFGNRDFYLNTPTWADLSFKTAFAAAVGGGPSLMHVDHETDPVEDEYTRRLTIGRDQYRRLVRYIAGSFQFDARGRTMPLIGRGYGWSDTFYESRRAYNFVRTCNEWTGEALRTAGIPMGAWTPLSQSIMWRLDRHR